MGKYKDVSVNNVIFGRFTVPEFGVYNLLRLETVRSPIGIATIPIKSICSRLAFGFKKVKGAINFLSNLGLLHKAGVTSSGCFRYIADDIVVGGGHQKRILSEFEGKDRFEVIKRLSAKIKQ